MEKRLPTDVTIDILTRLPSESIYQCKQVCKTWRSLINYDHLFAQKYQSRVYEQNNAGDAASGKITFLFCNADGINTRKEFYYATYAPDERLMKYTRIYLLPMDDSQVYRILGSCNGLLCISSDNYYDNDLPIYICNPVTKEYLILPCLSDTTFDLFYCGFGYLPSTNEYKVVKIYECDGDVGKRVYVYTLGSGEGWRYVSKITYELEASYSSVFVNGALHWVESTEGNIVCFDLAEEKFGMICSTPPCFIDDWPLDKRTGYSNYQLQVLRGSLCVVYKHSDRYYDIWAMNNGEKETHSCHWSRDFKTFEFAQSNYPRDAEILAVTEDDEVLFFNKYTFYSHDLKQIRENKLEHALDFERKSNVGVREHLLHGNSFVSLKALGEENTKILELSEVGNFESHLIGTTNHDDLTICKKSISPCRKGFEPELKVEGDRKRKKNKLYMCRSKDLITQCFKRRKYKNKTTSR